jgi:hypothetical protein
MIAPTARFLNVIEQPAFAVLPEGENEMGKSRAAERISAHSLRTPQE